MRRGVLSPQSSCRDKSCEMVDPSVCIGVCEKQLKEGATSPVNSLHSYLVNEIRTDFGMKLRSLNRILMKPFYASIVKARAGGL